jgi:hypothetical protein
MVRGGAGGIRTIDISRLPERHLGRSYIVVIVIFYDDPGGPEQFYFTSRYLIEAQLKVGTRMG